MGFASCRPVQSGDKHDKNLFLQLGATCCVINVGILTAISLLYLFFMLYLFLRLSSSISSSLLWSWRTPVSQIAGWKNSCIQKFLLPATSNTAPCCFTAFSCSWPSAHASWPSKYFALKVLRLLPQTVTNHSQWLLSNFFVLPFQAEFVYFSPVSCDVSFNCTFFPGRHFLGVACWIHLRISSLLLTNWCTQLTQS